jgi:hypothetical protein
MQFQQEEFVTSTFVGPLQHLRAFLHLTYHKELLTTSWKGEKRPLSTHHLCSTPRSLSGIILGWPLSPPHLHAAWWTVSFPSPQDPSHPLSSAGILPQVLLGEPSSSAPALPRAPEKFPRIPQGATTSSQLNPAGWTLSSHKAN